MFPKNYFPKAYFPSSYFTMLMQIQHPSMAMIVDEIKYLVPSYKLNEKILRFNLNDLKVLVAMSVICDIQSRPSYENDYE